MNLLGLVVHEGSIVDSLLLPYNRDPEISFGRTANHRAIVIEQIRKLQHSVYLRIEDIDMYEDRCNHLLSIRKCFDRDRSLSFLSEPEVISALYSVLIKQIERTSRFVVQMGCVPLCDWASWPLWRLGGLAMDLLVLGFKKQLTVEQSALDSLHDVIRSGKQIRHPWECGGRLVMCLCGRFYCRLILLEAVLNDFQGIEDSDY